MSSFLLFWYVSALLVWAVWLLVVVAFISAQPFCPACKVIFWAGGGNNWYEEGVIGNEKNLLYITCSFIFYSLFLFTAVMEVMAATIESLSKDDKFYAISHGVVHLFFMFKVCIAILKRGSIKKLIYDLIRACDSIDDVELSKKKYKEIKSVCIIYFSCMYGATFMYIIRGIINTFSGHYFYIIITYYPPPSDDSQGAKYFRVFTAFMATFIVTSVTNVDGLVISSMVIYKNKFILLKKYFEKLSNEYESTMSQPGCDVNAASNKLCEGLKEGVVMHIEVIRLSGEIDESLGILTATQLFSTSFPAVFQLLQVAFSDGMNVLDSIKVLSFIFTVFLLLGIYLTTIGNITEEAATLTDSIFYCGWHLCPSTIPAHRKIRALVLISSAISQQPISMKAFKMVELTHATYIKVIKSTYSVYALLRAQNQK